MPWASPRGADVFGPADAEPLATPGPAVAQEEGRGVVLASGEVAFHLNPRVIPVTRSE